MLSILKAIYTPFQHFIHQEKSGGIVLGISVIIALILANSPWSQYYFNFFHIELGFQFNGASYLNMSIHHWINDGLMALFFFIVGLELKRELIGGQLAQPRNALLPIVAAIGGMLVPALIYIGFNTSAATKSGWGIPMATDIAFALGVISLLGKRVPITLKVFLTALAIVDDLGAVLVIALFYTAQIAVMPLIVGLLLVLLLVMANKLNIRSIPFYLIVGIAVWVAFLLSGVHATIAAVLVAFTIPARSAIQEDDYIKEVQLHLNQFKAIDADDTNKMLSEPQLFEVAAIEKASKSITPTTHRMEQSLHTLITFLVIPIFAIANAGVAFNFDTSVLFGSSIVWGVFLGLLVGKVVGVVGFTMLMVKLKWATLPEGMQLKNLWGIGFLAAIGFTMSLFVTTLAFQEAALQNQAKIGIFIASLLGGVIGFYILKVTAPSSKKKL
jgi:NhaA family Na+:H+ antiporter